MSGARQSTSLLEWLEMDRDDYADNEDEEEETHEGEVKEILFKLRSDVLIICMPSFGMKDL